MISDVLTKAGAAGAVRQVAEAVVREASAEVVAVGQEAAAGARAGAFDRVVDALNRLPRPLMALGAMALLGYAMDDPAGFAARMQSLRTMPTELWWLIGGVLTFYFGAREAHYLRTRPAAKPASSRVGEAAK